MAMSKNTRFLLAQTPAIMIAGDRAVAHAVHQAKVRGLNIHYIEDGYLIEEAPDGKRTVLKAIDPVVDH
jgi:hypothetical protein